MPARKNNTKKNAPPTRSRNTGAQGSLTFLVLVLVILGIIVAILALKEPLTSLVAKDSQGAASPASTAKATEKPQETLAPKAIEPSPQIIEPIADATEAVASSPSAKPSPKPSPAVTKKPESHTLTVDGGQASGTEKKPAKKTATQDSAAPGKAQQKASNKALASTKKEPGTATLYMVKVTDDGSLELEDVKRSLDFGDSPLLNSISSLLKGPTASEMSEGMVSMIPQGTRLVSAWVSNGTAYLNFSENFMFNPLGSTGLHAQLKQVLYAATEFPTVESVQILIEGKKTDYLGGDNVYVGEPLTRKKFK